jgi:Transposase DDE domain
MDWQSRLIGVYLKVCDLWDQGIWTACQRFSNNQRLIVTDEEILSIYIYGIMEGHKTVKSIHSFTSAFLVEWFPQLGAYEAFNHRLTQISDVFAAMLEKLIDASDNEIHFPNFRLLMDSFPIVMANARRSSSAKVAPEVADKGYCDSKKMFYYGVKLHVAGHDRDSTLPKPSIIGLTPASYHDLTAFRQVAPQLDHCEIFSDKAYADHLLQKELRENQNVIVATPIKRKKGQNLLDSADRLYSKAVSSIRQPIESLFNWIEEKTGIQRASKVRSYQGLLVHIFGRMVAAVMLLKF